MKYNFKVTAQFAKDFKKLKKSNKAIVADFDLFLQKFDNALGKTIAGTGGAKKIRMAASEKGKRGGYRVIYYLFYENEVYFIKIYSKSVKEDISMSEKRMISELVTRIKNRNA